MNELRAVLVVEKLLEGRVRHFVRTLDFMALKNVFTYKSLVHAVAGAAGSVVAMTVFFPLDTARVRLQVDDRRKAKHSPEVMYEIAKEEGLSTLYQGLFPVVSSLCCSNFVYFYSFNGLKAVAGVQGAGKDLLFAFIAGCINVMITTPLWVVNTRLKLQGVKFKTEKIVELRERRYSGIIDCFQKIFKNEGIRQLWSGTIPSLALVANPSVQFMIYEAQKRYFQEMFQTKELSGATYFLIGAVAKTVATVLTYPLQVVQSRLRALTDKERKKRNMFGLLYDLFKVSGFFGMYKGLEAKLTQTVLTAALMFVCYEKIAAFIFNLMGMRYVSMKK